MNPTRTQYCGFTLVEMAVVLAIIGLLLAGLLMPLSAQVDQRRVSETQKALEEINQALVGFAVINGRLPCPADGTKATGTTGAGAENTTTSSGRTVCANASGVLPWAALGVGETDAWGRRYTYRVTTDFADSGAGSDGTACGATAAGVSFSLCSVANADIAVLVATGGANVATGVPALVVSHGKNGLGAYTPSGGSPITTAGAGADETENSNGDANFVSHTETSDFDDVVMWLSPNTLFNRMVAAGKLP